VHVFGRPCDVEAIQSIADKHGLHVIYDAAHAMGVRYGDRSILDYGDCSILSFHATKLFTTVEGGAIVTRSAVQRRRIDYLKNFGIEDEETVIGPGINGKLNEFQAAFGLLQLELLEGEIATRRRLTEQYRRGLEGIPGIELQSDLPGTKHNYSYFPILVDPDRYGADRDQLHALLRRFNVVSRKYFHPLCSRYSCYAALPSARPEQLPIAHRVADRVLCLPLFGSLDPAAVEAVCAIVRVIHESLSRSR
jgi:dTDP-4-amino-4,6-dideoxygalactose transaminase